MSSSASIPRWRTSDIDDHVAAKMAGYEAALRLMEGVITGLRTRVNQLEDENERLKWELASPPLLSPPVRKVYDRRQGYMTAADR